MEDPIDMLYRAIRQERDTEDEGSTRRDEKEYNRESEQTRINMEWELARKPMTDKEAQ